MSILYHKVSKLLSKEKVTFNELRTLIKNNQKELSAIKVSGKGRTKANVIKDLRLWLNSHRFNKEEQEHKWTEIEEDEEEKYQHENLSNITKSSDADINIQSYNHLLFSIENMIDAKLSELRDNLLFEFKKMCKKNVKFGVNDGQNKESKLWSNSHTMFKVIRYVLLMPFRLIWRQVSSIMMGIIFWIYDAVSRPIKWLLLPISIIISLIVCGIIINFFGPNFIAQYLLFSMRFIFGLFSELFRVIGGAIYMLLQSPAKPSLPTI